MDAPGNSSVHIKGSSLGDLLHLFDNRFPIRFQLHNLGFASRQFRQGLRQNPSAQFALMGLVAEWSLETKDRNFHGSTELFEAGVERNRDVKDEGQVSDFEGAALRIATGLCCPAARSVSACLASLTNS